jgi:microcystin-dependent protein
LFASAGTATSGTPSAANLPGQANGGFYTPATTAAITAFQLSPTAVGWAGGNQEHDNSMPSLALSYIIALVGIYPTAQ